MQHLPYLKEAARLYDLGDYNSCIFNAEAALYYHPNDDQALCFLGYSHLQLGDLDKACSYLAASIDNNANVPAARYFHLAYVYQKLAEKNPHFFDEAEKYYLLALQMEPEDLATLYNLSSLYVEKRQFQKALPHLEHCISVDPANPSFHCALGAALQGLNRFNEAEKSFLKAKLMDPLSLEAEFHLAHLYRAIGKEEKALATARNLLPRAKNADRNFMVESLRASFPALGSEDPMASPCVYVC